MNIYVLSYEYLFLEIYFFFDVCIYFLYRKLDILGIFELFN